MVLIGFLLIVAVIAYFVFKDQIDQYFRNRKSIEYKIAAAFKKDFSPECARCTFYAFHDYSHGYAQSEWLDYYKKVTHGDTLDKTSQEYIDAVAPLVNAVVIHEDEIYFRRGLEHLRNYCLSFYPGENDRISLNYFVEPYEYVACDESVGAPMRERRARMQNSQATPQTPSQQQPKKKEGLYPWEAAELHNARKRYEDAVHMVERNKGSSSSHYYEAMEKTAFADLMRLEAKYGGRE